MKKVIIILAVFLTAAGLALCAGAFFASGFDFSRLSSEKFETNTYTVAGADFTKIEIDVKTADVFLKPSDDGAFRAVCVESEKAKHTVAAEGGTLKVTAADERSWLDHIGIFRRSPSVTLYLPAAEYESLTIADRTGDTDIPDGFSFGSVDISATTGDVFCGADCGGTIKITTTTGDISVSGAAAAEMVLTVSTGHISADNISCSGRLSATVSTGRVRLSNVACGSFESEGSTGDVLLQETVASGEFSIRRSTGDVTFDNSDAGKITVKTSTGDVTGTLLTGKLFNAKASTGRVSVPESVPGGSCEISTTTGDIIITVIKPTENAVE